MVQLSPFSTPGFLQKTVKVSGYTHLKSQMKKDTLSGELPRWLSGKESTCQAGDTRSIPGSGRFPWRRKWQPTPIFLPGKSHGQRSLGGYSPQGPKRVRHDLTTKQQYNNNNLERTFLIGKAGQTKKFEWPKQLLWRQDIWKVTNFLFLNKLFHLSLSFYLQA